MRIGLLTGGGDCPGLNAAIRAAVRKGIDSYGDEMLGFHDGWRGVLEGSVEELTLESTRGILPRGGTVLRSSRTNPYKREHGVEQVVKDARAAPRRRSDHHRRRGHARRRQATAR